MPVRGHALEPNFSLRATYEASLVRGRVGIYMDGMLPAFIHTSLPSFPEFVAARRGWCPRPTIRPTKYLNLFCAPARSRHPSRRHINNAIKSQTTSMYTRACPPLVSCLGPPIHTEGGGRLFLCPAQPLTHRRPFCSFQRKETLQLASRWITQRYHQVPIIQLMRPPAATAVAHTSWLITR